MTYQYRLATPPVTVRDDRQFSKQDLIIYHEWFHSAMPKRMGELREVVRSTPGFTTWEADYSRESLGPLGRWYESRVKTRKQTPAEMKEERAKFPDWDEISDEELTDETFSLASDIGMYFGQVVLLNVPGTRWDQILKDKRFIDYGRPVITGLGKAVLNPVGVATSIAYGISRKNKSGDALLNAYNAWTSKVA